jgi:hypothetical protein
LDYQVFENMHYRAGESARASTPQAQQKLKIGFITPLSGPPAIIGKHMKDSVEVALEHLGGKVGWLETGRHQCRGEPARRVSVAHPAGTNLGLNASDVCKLAHFDDHLREWHGLAKQRIASPWLTQPSTILARQAQQAPATPYWWPLGVSVRIIALGRADH